MHTGQRLLLIVALPLALTGCAGLTDKMEASFSRPVGIEACGMTRDDVISRIDMRKLVREATRDFCRQTTESVTQYQESRFGYVVPDVVDIQTLKPEAFGIALGELLREHVVTLCKAPVRQAEFSPNIRLESGGMVSLTRDAAAVRARESAPAAAVVATYHLQPSKITLVVRRVGMESGLVDAMAARHVEWSCTTLPFGRTSFSYVIR